jgi:hypothetical protein
VPGQIISKLRAVTTDGMLPPRSSPPAREGGERQPVTIIVLVVALHTPLPVWVNRVAFGRGDTGVHLRSSPKPDLDSPRDAAAVREEKEREAKALENYHGPRWWEGERA